MKLTPIKANMTELEIGNKIILFSYKTPVAYGENRQFYRTSKKWSNTTTRHINTWLKEFPYARNNTHEIDQYKLDYMTSKEA